MRGLLYLLAVAGFAAAQGNQTVQTQDEPPSPSTTEETLTVEGGDAQRHPTCAAVTKYKTVYKDKPYTLTITKPKETITTTCYETTTVHDTTTSTSTTTCTVVGHPSPHSIMTQSRHGLSRTLQSELVACGNDLRFLTLSMGIMIQILC